MPTCPISARGCRVVFSFLRSLWTTLLSLRLSRSGKARTRGHLRRLLFPVKAALQGSPSLEGTGACALLFLFSESTVALVSPSTSMVAMGAVLPVREAGLIFSVPLL